MNNSEEFNTLKNRIEELENTLLPKYFQPDTRYVEDEWQDRISGYIVLVCAEIECYIERIIEKIVDEKFNQFNRNGTHSSVLFSLMAYYKTHWPYQDSPCNQCFWGNIFPFIKPHKSFDIQGPNDIKTTLRKIVQKYKQILNANHGIKSENLNKLLFPLGFDKLEESFIANLDSFTQLRGAHAHHTSVKIKKDPKNIKDQVSNLLLEFQKIDIGIITLK